MTPDEHKLMIFMFAQQTVRLKALLEALKSRGILESGDFAAFEHLAFDTFGEEAQIATINQYSAFATSLGLQDQLPRPDKTENPIP